MVDLGWEVLRIQNCPTEFQRDSAAAEVSRRAPCPHQPRAFRPMTHLIDQFDLDYGFGPHVDVPRFSWSRDGIVFRPQRETPSPGIHVVVATSEGRNTQLVCA